METREAKDGVEPKIGRMTQLIIYIFVVPLLITYFLFLHDVLKYTARDAAIWVWYLTIVAIVVFIAYKLPKDKPKWVDYLLSIGVAVVFFNIPTFYWINYKWSDPKTRHEELVTVKRYNNSRSIDMIVTFEDGRQRTVEMGSYHYYHNKKYDIGTTLPVTIERGFFGIDVIVEWGFENDEQTLLLPNSKYKER